jgi:hypothetical protein
MDYPFDVLCDDAPAAAPYPVSALMLEAGRAARCEDCEGPVFPHGEEEVRLALQYSPFDLARFCPRCEARRDVLGIPFDRPGPIPDGELARLLQEPREMGG